MSFSVPNSLPPIDPALVPAAVRNGDQQAKQAYQTGLAFEQMLVDELSQQLTATAGADGGSDGSDGSGGSDGGSDGSSGIMGSDPASSTYAQLLPTALSNGVMSAGGLGVAAQIAGSLDPALGAELAKHGSGS